MAPTPTEVGAGIGAAIATALTVYGSARAWLTNRSRKKIDAMAGELGVCESGESSGSPTLASLVMSTATSVQRLEEHTEKATDGIRKLLDVQETQGAQLAIHGKRLDNVETSTQALAQHVVSAAANAEILDQLKTLSSLVKKTANGKQPLVKKSMRKS